MRFDRFGSCLFLYVVDIGSNYVRHVMAGRRNIHFCTPILDVRDSARECERSRVLAGQCAHGRLGKGFLQNVCGGADTMARCYQKGQDCTVKAPYGMLVHSAYDMTWEQLGDCFDSHEFDVVWSVMHFDLRVFTRESFVMDDLQMVVTVTDGKIRFVFGSDSSLGYQHDYEEYMRLLYESVMVTKKGRVYLAERVHEKCGSLFIKFTWCKFRPMTEKLNLEFAYWGTNVKTVFVSLWKYDDGYYLDSKFKLQNVPNPRFNRKVMECDKFLVELVLGHVMRSGDKSFNLNDIIY